MVPDFSEEVEWLVTLEQAMPEREFRMFIEHVYEDKTWGELGDEYGFTGKTRQSRGAQANDAVAGALAKAGLRESRFAKRRKPKLALA